MILLLGKTGYIAQEFAKRLQEKEVDFYAISRSEVDYTDFKSIFYFLNANAKTFDTVINCSGYVGKPNVDVCEKNKEECIKGNIIVPKMLSEICSEFMIKFVHISSGCIYNGYDKAFTEEDPPNFSFMQERHSFYSGSKAFAEKLINLNTSYVCRLRIPFDNINSPRNYLSKLMTYEKLLNAKNSISHRGDFVDACLHLFLNNCNFGIYNIVNSGAIETKDVCELIGRYININKFKFFESEDEFYNLGAKAPRSNCLLDNSKLLATGFKMRETKEALESSLRNWQ